jgi:hypothetical protein
MMAAQLSQQAMMTWAQGNRAQAERLQRRALQAVQEGEARPDVVAQVGAG